MSEKREEREMSQYKYESLRSMKVECSLECNREEC